MSRQPGDDPKDIGKFPCPTTGCQPFAAIRKNSRSKLYTHCYGCGVTHGDNKRRQEQWLKEGKFFKDSDRPTVTPAPATPPATPPARDPDPPEPKQKPWFDLEFVDD